MPSDSCSHRLWPLTGPGGPLGCYTGSSSTGPAPYPLRGTSCQALPPSWAGWPLSLCLLVLPTARPFVPLAGVHTEMEGKVFPGFWPAPLLLPHDLAFCNLYYCPPELQPPPSHELSPQSRSSFRMSQPSATAVASPRTSRCTHTVDPGQGLLACTCHDYTRLPCILQLPSRSPSPDPAIWWGGCQG